MSKEYATRISIDLDQKQVDYLNMVKDHLGQKMGGKVSTAQAFRALVAGYVKRERLDKGEEG